jgi:hypothetical protein
LVFHITLAIFTQFYGDFPYGVRRALAAFVAETRLGEWEIRNSLVIAARQSQRFGVRRALAAFVAETRLGEGE